MKKITRKKSIIFISTIMTLLIVLGFFLVGSLDKKVNLIELIQVDGLDQEKLKESVIKFDVSDRVKGVKVKVVEGVFSSSKAWLLVEVNGLMNKDKSYDFIESSISVNDKSVQTHLVQTVQKNWWKTTYLYTITGINLKSDNTMSLSFQDIGNIEEAPVSVVAKGVWDLDLKFNYVKEEKVYNLNSNVCINDEDVEVKSVTLGTLSSVVVLKADFLAIDDESDENLEKRKFRITNIILNDGSAVLLGSSGMKIMGTKVTCNIEYQTVYSPSDVVAIEINGVRVDLQSKE